MARARLLEDATTEMKNVESYLWATEWMKLFHSRMTKLPDWMKSIANPMARASYRPDVLRFGEDRTLPLATRIVHQEFQAQARLISNDFEGAESMLRNILANEYIDEDNEIRLNVQAWLVITWRRQAVAEANEESRKQILRKLVDYVLETAPTIRPSGAKRSMVSWGTWAAGELGDENAKTRISSMN